jgi:hypothetical protein
LPCSSLPVFRHAFHLSKGDAALVFRLVAILRISLFSDFPFGFVYCLLKFILPAANTHAFKLLASALALGVA